MHRAAIIFSATLRAYSLQLSLAQRSGARRARAPHEIFARATQERPTSTELAWRVLTLVNLFRLLAPLLLGVLFVTMKPPPVGQAQPGLFMGAAIGYFLFAVLSIGTVKRRWPDIAVQAFVSVCVDVLAISAVDLRERRHGERPGCLACAADRRGELRRTSASRAHVRGDGGDRIARCSKRSPRLLRGATPET